MLRLENQVGCPTYFFTDSLAASTHGMLPQSMGAMADRLMK